MGKYSVHGCSHKLLYVLPSYNPFWMKMGEGITERSFLYVLAVCTTDRIAIFWGYSYERIFQKYRRVCL